MTRSATLNFQPRDPLAKIGNIARGFQFGSQVCVFEEGSHLRETGIYFVFEAAGLGNNLVIQTLSFGIDLGLEAGGLRIDLIVDLFDPLFSSRSSGAMKSCKS